MLYISDVCVSHNYKTRHLPDFCRIEIDDGKQIIINESEEDDILEINISNVGSIKFDFIDYHIRTFIGNCESIDIDNECNEYFNQIALKEKDLYIITIHNVLLNVFRFKIVKIADGEELQFIAEIVVEQIEKDNEKRRDSEDQTDN